MENYTAQTFDIPELTGISKTSIDEHIKLYLGYVKHLNLIQEKLASLPMEDTYVRSELQRRFSFEYCGMRNHELYFKSLVGGASEVPKDSELEKQIMKDFDSMDNFWTRLKEVCMTRGIGWAMLYYDIQGQRLVLSWVDEQHLGQLSSAYTVCAIDMWEHSYVADYQPSGKKTYVEDYIKNTNFEFVSSCYDGFVTFLKASMNSSK